MNGPQSSSRNRCKKSEVAIAAECLERLEMLTDRFRSRNPILADRLLEKLSRARIVASAKLPSQVVAIGRPVTYRDQVTHAEKTVTLVFPEDADVERDLVSLMTPIAVALIGLAKGDSFEWQTRDGKTRTMEILGVGVDAIALEKGAE